MQFLCMLVPLKQRTWVCDHRSPCKFNIQRQIIPHFGGHGGFYAMEFWYLLIITPYCSHRDGVLSANLPRCRRGKLRLASYGTSAHMSFILVASYDTCQITLPDLVRQLSYKVVWHVWCKGGVHISRGTYGDLTLENLSYPKFHTQWCIRGCWINNLYVKFRVPL